MKHILTFITLLIALAPGRTVISQVPPLIDRDLFFGDPQVTNAQISPDGEYISFIKPYRDVMNIWVKGTDEPFDAAKPITADSTRPVRGYFWSQDARYVLYTQDKGGNENFHVYVVDPAGVVDPQSGLPVARNITDLENTRAFIYSVPENTPGEIIVGLNDRDPRYHDVYRVNLETGERRLIRQNDDEIAGWTFDLEGNLRVAERVKEDGSTEILRVDGDELVPVYTCTVEESCYTIRFHKDNQRVYMISNKGNDVDLARLLLLDPVNLSEEVVEVDPEGQVDFGDAAFSDATEELVATYYVGDRTRIYPKDELFRHDLEILRSKLPEGEIYFSSSTEDDNLQIVSVTRDVDPGSTYLYNRKTGEVALLYRSRPELPSENLAESKPIRYQARDGLEIPAYLTTPRGVSPQNLPLVVLPHGGPWGRDTWGFDGFAQFLANRGYAVLQPNFRSSTGYGKNFLNLGNGEWGDSMQDDITDGVQYLIDQGIADPERIGIMGGSYGGYATLAGLTFTPDVYAAGVSIVGPSNLITLLNSIPPYWASVKHMFNVRIGNPDNPEDVERLKRQSPFYSAQKIKAPLLVVQGANDPRVKQAESDQIVVAARDNGIDVEYLIAPDEGHGFARRENRLAMAAAIEAFFAKHLKGRFQEAKSDEIADVLKRLTVDVQTVKLPE